jgi:hypothetical protein
MRRLRSLPHRAICIKLSDREAFVDRSVEIAAGLAIAAIAQFIAIMLTGAGHGWTAPLRYSLILFLAYPFALVRRADRAGTSILPDVVALGLGIGATLLLIVETRTNEAGIIGQFIRINGVFVIIVWVLLWLGWQALTVHTILRRVSRRA